VRPGTLPGVLSIRRQKRGCPWCKQLTRLLRASFADHETENIPKGRDVNNQANQAELAIFSRSLAYIG
jgi:glutaredoxin